MISIIIPTKNEENFLPRLLRSLNAQTFQEFEVIVADAFSTDRTRAIAVSFGAKVVDGGLPGFGRNTGARHAKGDVILFLDADVFLPPNFLEANYKFFMKRGLDCATTLMRPLSTRFDDQLIHSAWNAAYLFFQRWYPVAAGFHIFVKRSVFERVGGFDHSIVFAEDVDFVSRVHKSRGRFRVIRRVPVYISVRRLEKEGRFGFLAKSIYGFCYAFFRGPIRKPIFNYEFGHDSVNRQADS